MPTNREPRVAVVGATGAVGNEIVELIAARGLPFARLTLFASQSGASGTIETGEDEYLVEALHEPEDLAEYDIAFLAVPENIANDITRAAPGPLLIDLSGAARNPDGAIPMVAPGLTAPEKMNELTGARVLTIAHPAAHALALCIRALKASGVSATAMMGASAGGRSSIARMVDQTTDLLAARLDLEDEEIQRAFNAFSRETERATANVIATQAAVIAGIPRPAISVQAVSIPILHGSGLAISAVIGASGEAWLEILRGTPGVLLAEEGEPLSIIDAVGQEAIQISAERDLDTATLWCTFDNTRLAALAAVWVAETFAIGTPVAN